MLTSIDTSERRKCKACGLYLNQIPIQDDPKKSHVFWIGLSSVLITEKDKKIPLSPHTKSGALIKEIEDCFTRDISFYKTNVVKCLPLKNDKIRYPLKHEMEKCYPNLEEEIEVLNPSLMFLLGKQVSTFVLDKIGVREFNLNEYFNYESFTVNNIIYIPVHHPSYILVYKRKYINDYKNGIGAYIEKINASIKDSAIIFQD